MAGEHRKITKAQLALALAQGMSAASWARTNQVAKATAYRWAKDPEVRAAVLSYRRRLIDQAIGQMTRHTTSAAKEIARIAQKSKLDSVRLRACRAIFSDLVSVDKYSGLESRMTEIEDMIKKRNAAAEAYARRPTAYYGHGARPATTPAVPPGPPGLS